MTISALSTHRLGKTVQPALVVEEIIIKNKTSNIVIKNTFSPKVHVYAWANSATLEISKNVRHH